MKILLRTLLVWLVLLAVPFQGFAAAAMSCAHGVASSTAPTGHDGHGAKPPCHQGASQPAAGDDGAQAQDKKCGNCAACSVGAAIAATSGAANPDCRPCSCCPPAAAGRLSAADPDLPERPPRTVLA